MFGVSTVFWSDYFEKGNAKGKEGKVIQVYQKTRKWTNEHSLIVFERKSKHVWDNSSFFIINIFLPMSK